MTSEQTTYPSQRRELPWSSRHFSSIPLFLLFRIKPAALGFDSGFTGEKQTPYPSQRRQPTRAAATSHPFPCSSFSESNPLRWALIRGLREIGTKSISFAAAAAHKGSRHFSSIPLFLLSKPNPCYALGFGLGFTREWSKVPSAPFPAPGSALCRKLPSPPCSSFSESNPLCWAPVWGSRGIGSKFPLLLFRRQAPPSLAKQKAVSQYVIRLSVLWLSVLFMDLLGFFLMVGSCCFFLFFLLFHQVPGLHVRAPEGPGILQHLFRQPAAEGAGEHAPLPVS